MFCFQCEQTSKGEGCTKVGVCGKKPDVAALQDLLLYTTKGLSQVAVAANKAGISDPDADKLTCEAIFSTLTNVDFDPDRFVTLIQQTIAHRDQLKAKVEEQEVEKRLETEEAPAQPSAGAGSEGAGKGGRIGELIDIYRVEIAYQIQKNWAFPEQLAGGRNDLQTLLVFKVMPNGEIRDLFFTDRSGNTHLDESAFRAIMKTNPVDPHPSGIIRPYVQMGLRFTPEGIK